MEKKVSNPERNRSPWEVKILGVHINLLWALIYFVVVSWLWGRPFALVIMGTLLFHEYGHAWSMWRNGVSIKGMYFMPPLGLAVVSEGPWPSRRAEAEIGIMGPAWGLVMTLAVWAVGMATGSVLAHRVAGFVAFVNLFNLVPINPLDGGRITKSIAYSVSPRSGPIIQVAMLGLTIVMTVTYAPLVGILVLLMGYGELRQEIRNRNRAVDRKLIIEALADFLDKVMLANVSVTVPRTAPAVIDGLDSYYSGLASATPEQVRQRTDEWLATSPDTARRLLDLGYDYVDYCWDMPQAIACQARTPHYRLNGKTEEYVVSEEELGTGGLAFRESPLARFLGQVELPLMSGRASALFAGAYLALVATLFCIWHSAGGMQNFVELFKMLK